MSWLPKLTQELGWQRKTRQAKGGSGLWHPPHPGIDYLVSACLLEQRNVSILYRSCSLPIHPSTVVWVSSGTILGVLVHSDMITSNLNLQPQPSLSTQKPQRQRSIPFLFQSSRRTFFRRDTAVGAELHSTPQVSEWVGLVYSQGQHGPECTVLRQGILCPLDPS